MHTDSAPLTAHAAATLAEYYRLNDLAEHVRALPEAAAILGYPTGAARDAILADLDAQILHRLERLDALGLYPTTTTAVEVTVNGVPVALPELCREQVTNTLPDAGGPTQQEVSMEVQEHTREHHEHNGLDRSVDHGKGPSFFTAYVRPYLGYAAAFGAGAVCGIVSTHYFVGTESTTLSA